MSSCSHEEEEEEEDNESVMSQRFLIPQNFDESEDVEKYAPGGFHPVHLGDTYDDGRYRIVHRLGAGGFATVWLARDEREKKWVALKIVVAKHSASVGDSCHLGHQAISNLPNGPKFAAEIRRFTIEGPNGRHLCLVLPVLGPSAAELSWLFKSRLQPWLARRAGYQAAKAVDAIHAQGLCHGDVTAANILFTLRDIGEDDIYRLFGPPVTEVLRTESGEATGPEAPRYIVKALDFLSSATNIISNDVALIDFDQCFPVSSPPEKRLGTPIEYLAPELAVGLPPGPASDVWALGCCLFRLRAGVGPFSNDFEVTSPGDVIRIIVQTLGDLPPAWRGALWDYYGQPTRDPGKGKPLEKWEGERSLKDLVYGIYDQPEGNAVDTGTTRPEGMEYSDRYNTPFPGCFADMAWKPTAVTVDNVYLCGFGDLGDPLLAAMPKIPEREAALFYDLLSKIFVYDPKKRPTAGEILKHPWFHMDGQLD